MFGQSFSLDFPPKLFHFAYFPYIGPLISRAESITTAWPRILSNLANLAEKEDWNGKNNSSVEGRKHENQILHNYIQYTYQRLVIERKIAISEDGEYAAFNTGLLDRWDQEIFGFFKTNSREQPPWIFLRWATESDGDLMMNFENLPDMAEYVTQASDLVYDMRRTLVLDYAHILGERVSRFPPELQGSNPLKAKSALDAATKQTLKRLRRNYKLAIPQWYPKLEEKGAQLLLPLNLTGTGTADLALVISALNESQYRGYTVLTLEMAYTNARLVARPDSQWLQPLATGVEDQQEIVSSIADRKSIEIPG